MTTLRRALLTLLLALVLAGCLPSAQVPPPASFVSWLDDFGQVFTPADPPAGVISTTAVVQLLRGQGFPPFAAGARMAPPIYGVVTCVRAAACRDRGLVLAPGPGLAIWVVGYPDTPGGNGGTAWATVDARTGAFINGDGPPGP